MLTTNRHSDQESNTSTYTNNSKGKKQETIPFRKLVSEKNKEIDELEQVKNILQQHMPQLVKMSSSGSIEYSRAVIALKLLGDLMDECIYDVLSQVHRDVKLSKSKCQSCQTKCRCYVMEPGYDVFGNNFNMNNIPPHECVNCHKMIFTNRYAPHLEKCLGLSGRHSSRVTNQNEMDVQDKKRKLGNNLKYSVPSDTELPQSKKKKRHEVSS
ncbi:uncharacterized protein BX664DRAFT_336152 [Halteromyces radiatus]|uniref:uncharacterized protein n=1 Tax=Halteromyces radiatus TaxID=101107 RepID=UPI00221FD189|nr:uncharacterized protein BX664DRAFT_336152 [Halteromyces radiatus]KAI8086564.1 hypothetical protein BX664DRAFT_336152 [Halteromyces radiatus]